MHDNDVGRFKAVPNSRENGALERGLHDAQ